MSVLVCKKAPSFSAQAVLNGNEFVKGYSLDQFIGEKPVVFFFYPKISHLFVLQNYLHSKKNYLNLKIKDVL